MPNLRCAASLSLLLVAIAPGCTLAKPVAGAVIGPFVILAEAGAPGCVIDGGFQYLYVALAGVGAAAGLVTGAISDVQVLNGAAEASPTANWWHPFRTNTTPETVADAEPAAGAGH